MVLVSPVNLIVVLPPVTSWPSTVTSASGGVSVNDRVTVTSPAGGGVVPEPVPGGGVVPEPVPGGGMVVPEPVPGVPAVAVVPLPGVAALPPLPEPSSDGGFSPLLKLICSLVAPAALCGPVTPVLTGALVPA